MALHEGGIRTPLIVRHPGATHLAGRASTVQATFYDMLPTMAAIAGVAAPAGTDGRSLLPALMGEDQPVAPPFLFFEYDQPHDPLDGAQCSCQPGRCPLVDYPIAAWGAAVRSGNWSALCLGAKPAVAPASAAAGARSAVACDGAFLLYDLGADPGQTTDVAAAHPAEVSRLHAIIEAQHHDADHVV